MSAQALAVDEDRVARHDRAHAVDRLAILSRVEARTESLRKMLEAVYSEAQRVAYPPAPRDFGAWRTPDERLEMWRREACEIREQAAVVARFARAAEALAGRVATEAHAAAEDARFDAVGEARK